MITNSNNKINTNDKYNEEKFTKGIWILCNIVPMILFPIITFYLFESYTHNAFTTMKVPIQFLNIFFFILLMFLLFFIFGSLKVSLLCETVFFMIIGLVNYYIIEFRAAPIMPWDIYSIRTAVSVADNFKYTIEKNTVFTLIGFIILIVLETRVTLKLKKKKLFIRFAGTAVCMLLICGFTHMLHQDQTIIRFRMYDKLFTPTVMSKRDGTAVAFLMELKYMSVDKPAGYSVDTVNAILAAHSDDDNNVTVTDRPNIIVIMNEAFSDPAVLADFETNEDYMPYVHSLVRGEYKNAITGYLNVSVLGGNTANTEFEFLTGNTMAFLPQGSVAYQQYVKRETPSLASHLKELGYNTIAMHPYNSTGWNRNTVYPMLGFDKSYFIKDWTNPEIIRKYVSDKACYDKIIELYEEKPADSPLFVFNVTMQNHSSYSEEFDNFKPDITVEGTDSQVLPNYLSLMKISDESIKYLTDYFSDVSEDTIIVFFGDHQPTDSVVEPVWRLNGKKGDSLSSEDKALRYKVPFFIWANYDINGASDVEISANYLGKEVLKAAGLPLTPYEEFLDYHQKSFPVISALHAVDNENNSFEIKNVSDRLNQYSILQYYYLFGKR